MFQDIGVSKDLNEKFRSHLNNNAKESLDRKSFLHVWYHTLFWSFEQSEGSNS